MFMLIMNFSGYLMLHCLMSKLCLLFFNLSFFDNLGIIGGFKGTDVSLHAQTWTTSFVVQNVSKMKLSPCLSTLEKHGKETMFPVCIP